MSNLLTIAYACEGPTDARFLSAIIQRTYEQLLLEEARQQIDVFEPQYLAKSTVHELEKHGQSSNGYDVLCIHCDADAANDSAAFQERINPILVKLKEVGACSNIVPIVPVYMTEAWLLASKTLLKEELITDLTDTELGIHRAAEGIADPKQTIVNAIQVVDRTLPVKQRNQIKIADLYQPIATKVPLADLERLPSYQRFKQAARASLEHLNYIHKP